MPTKKKKSIKEQLMEGFTTPQPNSTRAIINRQISMAQKKMKKAKSGR